MLVELTIDETLISRFAESSIHSLHNFNFKKCQQIDYRTIAWFSSITKVHARSTVYLETIVRISPSYRGGWLHRSDQAREKYSRYFVINGRGDGGGNWGHGEFIFKTFIHPIVSERGYLPRRGTSSWFAYIYIIHRRIARHETRMDTIRGALADRVSKIPVNYSLVASPFPPLPVGETRVIMWRIISWRPILQSGRERTGTTPRPPRLRFLPPLPFSLLTYSADPFSSRTRYRRRTRKLENDDNQLELAREVLGARKISRLASRVPTRATSRNDKVPLLPKIPRKLR